MTGWVDLPLGEHVLAECPRWDPATATLSWVDIVQRRVCWSRPDGDGWGPADGFGMPGVVTAAVPTERGWWVATGSGVVEVDRTGTPLGAELAVSADWPAVRTNDMALDPAGRLVVSLFTEDRSSPHAAVVAVDPAAGTAHTLVGQVVTGNGLGFSPDGRRLYAVDTARGTLSRYAYDVAAPAAVSGQVLVTRPEPGRLDGLAVDPSGDVWVAVWDAGQVHRYAPDGALVTVLPTPVGRPSAVAVAGPHDEWLVVTTARADLDPVAGPPEADPAGRLYACPRPR